MTIPTQPRMMPAVSQPVAARNADADLLARLVAVAKDDGEDRGNDREAEEAGNPKQEGRDGIPARALRRAFEAHRPTRTPKQCNCRPWEVEPTGLEPVTFWLPAKRSPS